MQPQVPWLVSKKRVKVTRSKEYSGSLVQHMEWRTTNTERKALRCELPSSASQNLKAASRPFPANQSCISTYLYAHHSCLQTGTRAFHREPGKRAHLCSGVRLLISAQTGNCSALKTRSPPGTLRREWCGLCPGIPPILLSPDIQQIIPPFPNTQFSLPHQMPFTSTTTPTLLNFLLSSCERGPTRCKIGSAAPPPPKAQAQVGNAEALLPLLYEQEHLINPQFKARN